MDIIKEFLHDNQIFPKVDFSDKAIHFITILDAKRETFTDKNNKETEGIKFLVEENGEKRTILTTSAALLIKMRDCEIGENYKIQMKYVKVGVNPVRTYDVWKVVEDKEVKVDVKEAEIPIVEEGEGTEGDEPSDGLFD